MRKFLNSQQVVTGASVIFLFVIISILAPFFTPYPYWEPNFSDSLVPPSLKHLFGTDQLGRDVFTRTLFGTRPALLCAAGAAILSGIIGVTLGTLAGYFGKLIDRLLSGLMDLTWSFPTLLLAIALVVMMKPGLNTIIIAISATWWAEYARVIRGEVLAIREQAYVEAARALGCSNMHIISREIIPNVIPSIIVLISITMGQAIIIEAMLSFLGMGIQPPIPSWGAMLSDNRVFISRAPWICIFPGAMLTLLVLAFNLLGDGLRDVLDPYIRSSR